MILVVRACTRSVLPACLGLAMSRSGASESGMSSSLQREVFELQHSACRVSIIGCGPVAALSCPRDELFWLFQRCAYHFPCSWHEIQKFFVHRAELDQTNVEVRQVSVAVPAVSQAVVLHDDQI